MSDKIKVIVEVVYMSRDVMLIFCSYKKTWEIRPSCDISGVCLFDIMADVHTMEEISDFFPLSDFC